MLNGVELQQKLNVNKLNCTFGIPCAGTIGIAWYISTGGGGGRLLECENPPPVLVNAPPPLLHACQLSAPWALARAVTVLHGNLFLQSVDCA